MSRRPLEGRSMRRLALTAVVTVATCACVGVLEAQDAGTQEGASVVYLVRHAEKADDGTADPPLTERGRARAVELSRVLADAPLTTVLSTDFERTRSTAAPVAESHGLAVEAYDPGSVRAGTALVERLRTTPGHHLVVGHSNTTPALVAALGGDPEDPIDEAGEYDRLYVVWIGPDGVATSALLRFGEAYAPGG